MGSGHRPVRTAKGGVILVPSHVGILAPRMKTICPICTSPMIVPDTDLGKYRTCRRCGAQFVVAPESATPKPVKQCAGCGTDVGGTTRVKDAQGNYYCEQCWAERVAELDPEQTRTADSTAVDLDQLAVEPIDIAAAAPALTCASCGGVYPGYEMFNDRGRPICPRCRGPGAGKLVLKLCLAALAAIVLVGGLTVTVSTLNRRTEEAEQQLTDQAATANAATAKRTRAAEVAMAEPPPPPPPAVDVGAKLPELFARATAAKAQGDYLGLIRIHAERAKLIASATRGSSAVADAWLDDADAIAKARALVGQLKYPEAVRLLRARVEQRDGVSLDAPARPAGEVTQIGTPPPPPAATPVGANAPLFDGDLAVALAEASVASAVVNDAWELPDAQMSDLLKTAEAKDPACVRATVLRAWLIHNDPAEELLRLDVRPSVVQRNELLLPIRTALLRAVNADPSAPFEAFQQKLAAVEGCADPAVLTELREVMASLDYSLGLSRQDAETEDAQWRRLLGRPTLDLRDRQKHRYTLSNGWLWRQVSRGGGGYEWQLLVPQPKTAPATNPSTTSGSPAQWVPFTANLVLWTGPASTPPPEQADLIKRVSRGTPLPLGFPNIKGNVLCAYPAQNLDPADLMRPDLAACFLRLKTIRSMWVGSNRLADAAGRSLAVDIEELRQLAPAIRNSQLTLTAPEAHPEQMRLDLRPAFVVFEPQDPTALELFDDHGQSYFLSADEQEVFLRPGGVLAVRTGGGGVVLMPLSLAPFDADAVRDPVSRLFKAVEREGGAEPLTALRSIMAAAMGRPPGDAEVIATVIPPAGAEPDLLRKPPVWTRGDFAWQVEATRRGQAVDEVRRFFSTRPYGMLRSRLVRLAGGELEFLDRSGEAVPQFYSSQELAKLAEDTRTDFLRSSFRTVPLPFGIAGEDDAKSFRAFMKARAAKAQAGGDYHLAATLCREVKLPVFAFKPFDSTKPKDKAEMLELQAETTRQAVAAKLSLQTRRQYADVLAQAGMNGVPEALRRTGRAEWQACGLPLLDDLRRYSEAYGYATDPQFEQAYRDITAMVARAATAPADAERAPATAATAATADAPSRDAAVTFQPDRASRDGEGYLESFYAKSPSFDEYLKAKRWALASDKALLYRGPRADADKYLLFWTPIALDAGKPRRITDEEVFGGGGGDSVAATAPAGISRAWAGVLYAVETAPRDASTGRPNYLAVRNLLIDLALAERSAAAATGDPFSMEALAHRVNAVGALSLAVATDGDLPAGFAAARFGAFVLPAGGLEITSFLRPRLLAAGLETKDANTLLDPLEDMLRGLSDATDPSSAPTRRYYWAEYAPLVDDYREFLKAPVASGDR